jgi:signal peptidase I
LANLSKSPQLQELEETANDSVSRWQGVKSLLRETIETVVLTLLIFFLIRTFIQNFRIEGASMEPNMHDGQYLIISKVTYWFHSPQRGDVVVFDFPRDPNRQFIKRIIGLPGDNLEIKQGRVFINSQLLEEPYSPNASTYSWGPVTIGPDEYFVLGDNRPYSSDSHSGWMLPRDNIIGKAWISYWPPQYWMVIPHYSFAAKP